MKSPQPRTEADARLGAADDPRPEPRMQGPSPADELSGLGRLGRLVQRELTRRMAEAIDVGGEISLLEERA